MIMARPLLGSAKWITVEEMLKRWPVKRLPRKPFKRRKPTRKGKDAG